MTETAPDPRRIEYLPIGSLSEDPRNPKSHALDAVSASVGRFGFIEPVVRDERTGYIISGHGRSKVLAAMQERGETPPNGVRVDEDGIWHIPVVVGWSSRTDLDASGALIALNRTTELGGWVDDALLDLLDDLTADDELGLEGVGFTEDDRAALEHLEYDAEEDGPRDLDALHESVGDPTEEDSYERVSLMLPSDLATRLRLMVGDTAAENAEAAERWLDALSGTPTEDNAVESAAE